MLVEQGSVVTDDGRQLWFRKTQPRRSQTPTMGVSRSSDAPALLLCNGAACSTHYWPLLVSHFSPALTTVEWDYRGHGRSQRSVRPEELTIERLAADGACVLTGAGVSKAVVVGHSLGVQVVLELAHREPERVVGVVALFGAYGEIAESMSTWPMLPALADGAFGALGRALQRTRPISKKLLRTPPVLFVASLVGANRALLPPGYLEQLMDHVNTMDAQVALAAFQAGLRYSAKTILQSFERPLLIVGGGRDKITPPILAHQMHRLASGSELTVIPHASHLGLIEDAICVHYRMELFLRDNGLVPATLRVAKLLESA